MDYINATGSPYSGLGLPTTNLEIIHIVMEYFI